MPKNQVYGPFEHWSMVLLYDPKTGDIVHGHQVVTTGGQHPDRTALEKEAAEHASRARKTSIGEVAFLHVDPREIDSDAYYTVDTKTRVLVKSDSRKPKP
jgi:hypothetical protein